MPLFVVTDLNFLCKYPISLFGKQMLSRSFQQTAIVIFFLCLEIVISTIQHYVEILISQDINVLEIVYLVFFVVLATLFIIIPWFMRRISKTLIILLFQG